MESMGFSVKWRRWIRNILIKGVPMENVKIAKGLHQRRLAFSFSFDNCDRWITHRWITHGLHIDLIEARGK